MMKLFIAVSCIFILQMGAYVIGQTFSINITVAQDRSTPYNTIRKAIEASPNNSQKRFYIKIKAGVYRETLEIGIEKQRITLIGDGIDKTVVIGHKSNGTGFQTKDTPTIKIKGHLFVAINMTFENDAGPKNKQAIALQSEVHSAFYKCIFKGFQDTLNIQQGNQFYRDCYIYGTIDFIFGNGKAVFQNSYILVRKPLPNQYNTITAQGKRSLGGNGEGIVFHNCYLNASNDFENYKNEFKTYLGRPWGIYSTVVYMQTYMNDLIDPQGWVEWGSVVDKVYYAEYRNKGPGSATDKRAKWPGVRILNNYTEASKFSVRNFIEGDKWIPSTGIPFIPDL